MFGYDAQHTGYTESPAPENNLILWTYEAGNSVSSPVVTGGKVYFGSNDHHMYCLDAFTGSLIWAYETGGKIYENPALADGKVYFGSDDGYVYCLNRAYGFLIWKYNIGKVYSHIIIPTINDGKVYVGKLRKTGLYCLDAANGNLVWVNEEVTVLQIGVAVDQDNVYVPTDYDLYCLNASNGSIVWKNLSVFCYSCPAVADGKVYVGTLYGDVYCCDAEDGSPLWSYRTERLVPSCPAVAYGMVYVGGTDHYVYCLDADDGSLVWKYDTGSAVRSSPAVADGKVYVGSNNHHLYCLDAYAGDLLWRYKTDYQIVQSPAISNGILYIGPKNIMYAIGEPSLPNKTWETIVQETGLDLITSTCISSGLSGLIKALAMKGFLGALGSTGPWSLGFAHFIIPTVIGGWVSTVTGNMLEAFRFNGPILEIGISTLTGTAANLAVLAALTGVSQITWPAILAATGINLIINIIT